MQPVIELTHVNDVAFALEQYKVDVAAGKRRTTELTRLILRRDRNLQFRRSHSDPTFFGIDAVVGQQV